MKFIELPELQRLSKALTHYGPECAVHTRIEAYSCKNINRDKRLFRELEHAYADEHANAIHNAHPSVSLPTSNSINIPKSASHRRNSHGTQSQSLNSNHSSSTVNLTVPSQDDSMMPFGPMDSPSARKTLYLLIATLNVAFPHHEFSDVKPAHFCREPNGASVLNALSTTLVAPHRPGMQAPRTYSSYPPPTLPTSSSPSYLRSSMEISHSPNSGSVSGSFSNLSLNSSSLSHSYNIPRSPYSPPAIISGTHPTLYRLLDSIIGLSDCAVYSYTPDIASDPHAIDDDEDGYEEFDEGESEEDDVDDAFGRWGGTSGSYGSTRSGLYGGRGVNGGSGSGARSRSGKGGWIPAEDDMMFELYDDYDVDEISNRSEHRSSRQENPYRRRFDYGYPYADSDSDSPHSGTRRTTTSSPPKAKSSTHHDSGGADLEPTHYTNSSHSRLLIARKKHGALLWSSHWFFHNKKMKRILFVSVWARTHGERIWLSDEEDNIFGYGAGFAGVESEKKREERFFGWEGAEGAGARAMGIKYVSPSTLG